MNFLCGRFSVKGYACVRTSMGLSSESWSGELQPTVFRHLTACGHIWHVASLSNSPVSKQKCRECLVSVKFLRQVPWAARSGWAIRICQCSSQVEWGWEGSPGRFNWWPAHWTTRSLFIYVFLLTFYSSALLMSPCSQVLREVDR